jgi:hypothetical protein
MFLAKNIDFLNHFLSKNAENFENFGNYINFETILDRKLDVLGVQFETKVESENLV